MGHFGRSQRGTRRGFISLRRRSRRCRSRRRSRPRPSRSRPRRWATTTTSGWITIRTAAAAARSCEVGPSPTRDGARRCARAASCSRSSRSAGTSGVRTWSGWGATTAFPSSPEPFPTRRSPLTTPRAARSGGQGRRRASGCAATPPPPRRLKWSFAISEGRSERTAPSSRGPSCSARASWSCSSSTVFASTALRTCRNKVGKALLGRRRALCVRSTAKQNSCTTASTAATTPC
mmetsp:Transcript_26845/g.92668  ORF Transcript_26845/g.92668 Transcript_26845/m.92668 type:complete len:234 (-) Transcript_26845:234-935(-)